MSEPRCETCQFYRSVPAAVPMGECRRYAPRGGQNWAPVEPTDWCGEYGIAIRITRCAACSYPDTGGVRPLPAHTCGGYSIGYEREEETG